MHDPRLHPPQPYSALIFDCDGTLVDSAPVNERAWRQALATWDVDLAPGWYHRHMGLSADALLAALEAEIGRPLDRRIVHGAVIDALGWMAEDVRPHEPVAAVAWAHRGRTPMAVACGGSRWSVEGSLRATGLHQLFDVVVTRDDVCAGKPAPDVYLLACLRLDVRPADCVAYEDTDEGVAAATAAGLRVIDVRPVLAALRFG